MQCTTVTIPRGTGGYGFTISSDSPVRVQAVDPGGPADQAGLRRSDSLLQLNGQPVKHWKCVDLANAIRHSAGNITLMVCRMEHELNANFERLVHHPSFQTPHGSPGEDEKDPGAPPVPPHRQTLRRIVVGGREAGIPRADDATRTQTLRGTRVKASNGGDYLILSHINPGSQMFPVRQMSVPPDASSRSAQLRRSGLPTAQRNPQPNPTFSNYQNCTLVRSHHSTRHRVAPRTLVFPVSVQAVDVCSPSRTLLMSEQMLLHESSRFSLAVTLFIYSDLMLVTREDELGRCNVLQNPLLLAQLRLHNDSGADVRFSLIHVTQQGCGGVLSLQTFSVEQKERVCECLRENIRKQLRRQPTYDSPEQMLEPKQEESRDLSGTTRSCEDDRFPQSGDFTAESSPSETLTEEQQEEDTNAPSSSSSFIIPELRLDRSYSADALSTPGSEEESEEDDSDDNFLERSDSKRRSMVEATSCEKHLSVQNSLRRRTHSEGSLLQDPRGSDQAGTLPSPDSLKKELRRSGGSMQQLYMLFSRRKLSGGSECSCEGLDGTKKKKKSKNLAKDMKNRLAFLRRRSESPGHSPAGKLDKTMRPSPEEALKWSESLDKLLVHKYGLAAFRAFLRTEFSEENLDFWLACEDYKKIKSQSKMASKSKKIFAEFVAIQACREVNLDSCTRELTKENLQNASRSCFDLAQRRIYALMEKDSYARFLRSELYMDLVNQKKASCTSSSSSS